MMRSFGFASDIKNTGKLLLLLALLIQLPLHSQKKLQEQADVLFYQKKYTEAFTMYTKLYDKKPERELLVKMGDCCYLRENFKDAFTYYAQYFADTFFVDIPQYEYFAQSCKNTGHVALAARVYQKIFENKKDPAANYFYQVYKLYNDSLLYTRSYNLDSNYNCLVLDASESVDPDAAPMWYLWDFGEGLSQEGIVIEHCFAKPGLNQITLNIKDKKTGVIRFRDTAMVVDIQSPPVGFKTPKVAKQYFYHDYEAKVDDLKEYKILEYIWDMGNGDHCSGAKIKYKYDKIGFYTIQLTIVGEHLSTGTRKLFSAYKTYEVVGNYQTPNDFGKTLKDATK